LPPVLGEWEVGLNETIVVGGKSTVLHQLWAGLIEHRYSRNSFRFQIPRGV